MLRRVKQGVAEKINRYISVATLAEGTLKGSEESFRCLVVQRFPQYLLARTFAGRPTILSRRPFWLPSLRRLAENPPARLDLCIAQVPMPYQHELSGLFDHFGPRLVKQVLPISSWDEVRRGFHRTKKRLVNQLEKGQALKYRISNDPTDFSFFYHRMFRPHIENHFGGHGSLDAFEKMRKSFESGFLVFAEQDGQPLAAVLCAIEGQTLTYRRVGVLDGDEQHIRSGAQTALQYYQIRLACEKSLKAVNFMYSAPILRDGVYRSKREWGADVLLGAESSSEGMYGYLIPRASEKVARHFGQNPTFVVSGERLLALVGVDADPSEEQLKSLAKAYRTPGLGGLLVLTPHSKVPIELPFQD